jgi:TRAP-type C4-dicarboxylate transport system permease small subunit
MSTSTEGRKPWPYRLADGAMALTLGVMALAVFVNVVLRYGFGSGIAASEELSRLLFVWMVFIGATAAYPLGEHMAFTSLLLPLRGRMGGLPLKLMTIVIHLLVVLSCVLVGWGAWQQVVVGMGSTSAKAMGTPMPITTSMTTTKRMATVPWFMVPIPLPTRGRGRSVRHAPG